MKTTEGAAEKTKILFVCEDNTGPSQIAEAFAQKCGINACSAGRHATSALNPFVVQAMKEKGIDISSKKPKPLSPQIISEATLVVTLGCSFGDAYPQSMVARMREKTINWDWKGLKCRHISDVRETRDEIERRVIDLSKQDSILLEAV